MSDKNPPREGSLEAPTRHPIDWQNPNYYDQAKIDAELERVFDHCHGCRRCVSLCDAFPTLFDLVDESDTMEVDGVAKSDYKRVVDECYLCDLCFLTKCPYTPPHEWALDFPHLMLRAKAANFRKNGATLRDKLLTNTDWVGRLAATPGVASAVNAANSMKLPRKALQSALKIDEKAWLPKYHAKTLRKRLAGKRGSTATGTQAGPTTGKVAIFTTCYGNFNEPGVGEDLAIVLEHNDIAVTIAAKERCCGMPKLELGDLDAVAAAKDANTPALLDLVNDGWDIMAPVPSCALMFRQELPLMFPGEEDVQRVADAIFDPFEYLMARHKHDLLRTDFKKPLGKVAYHSACHQRVQNFGPKTRDALSLIPDTEVTVIERCSGHDGTYAVKCEHRKSAEKIVRPVVGRVKKAECDYFGSDCPMAGHHIEDNMADGRATTHPISLMRMAYGI